MATTTYCTESDITDRKGTDNIAKWTGDPNGSNVDSAKVTAAIEEFASKLNSAIRKQYDGLPFDATHKQLNGLNVQGAYLLIKRDSDRGWTEQDIKEWELLLGEVDNIADGSSDLRDETDDEEETMTDSFFSSNDQVFGRSKGL